MNVDSKNQKADSFPLFDWLRFVLASTVALAHEHVVTLHNAANLAVQVFFALSGWLIGGILLRTEWSKLPRFYYNRATRIWIPYFIASAFLYAVAALHESVGPVWYRCLFYDATFTHNLFIDPLKPMPLAGTGNHFWSIAVEEQFYLAAPILLFIPKIGRSIAFWTFLAFVAVATQSWYGSISLGVLAAVIRQQHGDWHLRRLPWIGGVAIALAAALYLLPNIYALLAPPFALMVIYLTSIEGARSPAGEFLGGVSYPLYLWHWTGMFVANIVAKHVPLPSIGLAAYLVAVIAGTGAYLLIDRNIMAWRGRLYRPVYAKIFMVTAYALFCVGVLAATLAGY